MPSEQLRSPSQVSHQLASLRDDGPDPAPLGEGVGRQRVTQPFVGHGALQKHARIAVGAADLALLAFQIIHRGDEVPGEDVAESVLAAAHADGEGARVVGSDDGWRDLFQELALTAADGLCTLITNDWGMASRAA